MQEELLQLWEEVRFTLLFVTHSIEEALIVGNRILLLSPHRGACGRRWAATSSTCTAWVARRSSRQRSAFIACCSRRTARRRARRCRAGLPRHPHRLLRECNHESFPARREEYEIPLQPLPDLKLERELPLAQRLWQQGWLRKTLILLALALIWELAARYQGNDLLLPSFLQTAKAFFEGIGTGELLEKVVISLSVLVKGYLLGIGLAFLLTTLAVSTQLGRDLLSTLTSMFNPLPAIALLPLSLLWFGLGENSLIFVLVHSVLWALALNTYAGFLGVSETQRMAGRNYGLKGLRFVLFILIPAALPSILAGLKIGWAFAWRT